MPNHVTNIISFAGPEERIVELRNKIRGEEEDSLIDFNKIIPQPDSLGITSGSKTDFGIAVLLFKEKGDSSKLIPILKYPWVKAENIKTIEQLVDFLIESGSADLEHGRIALENLEKYGHQDWYSWSIENWGTKWNSYSAREEEDKIIFVTAWNTPIPVIQKLSEMFPDIKITLQFADEDFGYNCGEVIFVGGDIIKENCPEGGSTEAYVFASKVQDISLEELLLQIGDSENEDFIEKILLSMFEQFSPKDVVDELETLDDEFMCFSDTFLSVLKQTLLDNEIYELISKVDDKIKKTESKEEQ